MLLVIGLLLAAGPAGHRARAERAEALGRMQDAAREFEAAWEEEQAPDLLYHLGLARRKLKQYGKARAAFRAYLRAAPEGGLREEVERQLAKLEVLIEAQAEDYGDEPPPAPPPVPAVPPPVFTPLTAAPVVPRVERAREPAPPAAVAMEPLRLASVRPRSRAAPWLAAGAAVALVAGGVLWWDGARVARDLDARFAAGDLAAGDRPLFGRARGESIAGRALVIAGAALAGGAVLLWW